jgi:hypothetical protein
MAEKFEFVRGYSDSELEDRIQSSEKLSRDTWVRSMPSIYLVLIAPVLVAFPLIRAAERSNWMEISLWVFFAALGVFMYFKDKEISYDRAFWRACLQERRRRADELGNEPAL